MNLLSKLRNVTATSALVLAAGCQYVPLGNDTAVYGSRLGVKDGAKNPFIVPTINHSGYILSPHMSERRIEGEFPLVFWPYKRTDPKNPETLLVKDEVTPKWGRWDLETPNVFVAEPYFVGEGANKKPVKEIRFKDIKAHVSTSTTNDNLGVRNYTHHDLTERIPTIWLDTDNNEETPMEQFYAPRTVERGLTKERLLISVDKTKRPIGTETGQIRLRVKEDVEGAVIYRLREMQTKEYIDRPVTNPVETTGPKNTVEAIGTGASVEIIV